MDFARQLKEQSLYEYLLFMFQVEDVIRACKFDRDTLSKVAASRYGTQMGDLQEGKAWFLAMADLMEGESIQQSGHLQHVQNLVNDLFQLHLRLIKSPKEVEYQSLYYESESVLVELRRRGIEDSNVVELALVGVYGVWLLGLKGVSISTETRQAVEILTRLLALLSDNYSKIELGEKELPEIV